MLHKNKPRFSGLFTVTLVLLAAGLWSGFLVPTVLAQAGGAGTAVRGSLPDDLVQWMSKLAAINTFMHILLLILLDFLGYFLRADFFTNPKMMEALNNIWVLARDIMNIIFALTLIGVAFYTIITGNSKYIKEKISQFVIAVILVNFSWFFPRVIIDVANILTGTVYAVPNMLPTFTCKRIEGDPPVARPCKVITDKLIFGDAAKQDSWQGEPRRACGSTPAAIAINCPCTVGIGCYKLEEYETAKNIMEPAYAMLNGLAVSFVNITQLPKIPAGMLPSGPITTGQAAMTTFQILMNVVFAFIMQLAIVLPLLGMAVGFLIRILVVWLTTAFMPFSFLGYLFTGKLGTNFLGLEDYIWKPFIEAAFLPATVGVPIVIGFILLSTSAQIPAPSFLNDGTTWAVPIFSGVQTWWQMLWMIAAVMIVWKGSFAALSRSKLVGGITDRIKNFGEWVGKGAMQLPLITPMPFAGGMRLGALVHAPRAAGEALQRMSMGTTGNKSWSEVFGEQMGVGGTFEVDRLAKSLKNDSTKTDKINTAVTALQGLNIGRAERETHLNAIRSALGPEWSQRSNVETLDIVNRIAASGNAPDRLKTTARQTEIAAELNKERNRPPPATAPPTAPPAG